MSGTGKINVAQLAQKLLAPRTIDDIKSAAVEFPTANEIETEVFRFGARKYSVDGFRAGVQRKAALGSALRHIYRELAGEKTDPESGLPHLAHARWNCGVCLEPDITRDDVDPSLNRKNASKPRFELIPIYVMEALAQAYEETQHPDDLAIMRGMSMSVMAAVKDWT
jgi:hypothetical protein